MDGANHAITNHVTQSLVLVLGNTRGGIQAQRVLMFVTYLQIAQAKNYVSTDTEGGQRGPLKRGYSVNMGNGAGAG